MLFYILLILFLTLWPLWFISKNDLLSSIDYDEMNQFLGIEFTSKSKFNQMHESFNDLSAIEDENELINNLDANKVWFPDGVHGDNISGYQYLIVPNIVHYILFDSNHLSFVHFLSIKSVIKNHRPDLILIHCTCSQLMGKYWNWIQADIQFSNIEIKIRKIIKPKTIFGKPYSKVWHNWHASDIMRNRVLMEFGGIYLDNDVYVVKSLDPLRKFEMTLDYEYDKQCMGSQVQIAHKDARFLKLYFKSYQYYNPNLWYFNAGEFPTEIILKKYPHLIHRVNYSFGVTGIIVCPILYGKVLYHNWESDYYAFHLFLREDDQFNFTRNYCVNANFPYSNITHYFDEESVKKIDTIFGQMARLVLYNTKQLINN